MRLSTTSVAITVAITYPTAAAITALVNVIILYLCGSLKHKHNSSSKRNWTPQEYEIPIVKGATTSGLEMKSNTAYGQVQYTVPTSDKQYSMYETVSA